MGLHKRVASASIKTLPLTPPSAYLTSLPVTMLKDSVCIGP